MIYFDDELPPEIKAPRTRAQRWRRRILITLASLLVFLWISLRILALVGGNNPALRTGIENYLRGATGYQARIGTFNSLTFYPALSLDIADVQFSSVPAKASVGQPQMLGLPVAHLAHLQINMGFWDMIFARNRVRILAIDGLDFGHTLPLARQLIIDHVAVEKTGTAGDARLNITGHYGADPFTAWQAMRWQAPEAGTGGSGYFYRSEPAEFALTSPFLTLAGNLSTHHGIEKFIFTKIGTPEKILTGQIDLQRPNNNDYDLRGQLTSGKSILKFTVQRMGQVTHHDFNGSQIYRVDRAAFEKFAASLRQIYPPLANALWSGLPPDNISRPKP